MDLSIWQFFVLALVAGICGSVAQLITGFTRGGCLVSVALGFIGALIGVWLSRALGIDPILNVTIGGTRFPVIWSILGASLFAAVISALTPRPPRKSGRD